jgi:hypothetical protein
VSARVPFQGFIGSAFRNQSYRFDSQDLWNWFVERADSPHAKQPQALLPCPGFQRFATLPTPPVRGLFAQNNRLFAVGGSYLYEISNTGTITLRPMTVLASPTTPIITQNPLAKPILAPKMPIVTHGGAVGATVYGYRVTATNEWGETEGSDQGVSTYGNATLSATNWNIVSWSYVEGATGYKVYQTYPIPKLIAVVASTTLVVNDIGNQGTPANPPLGNTTGAQAGTSNYGYCVTALIGLGETAVSPMGVTNTGPYPLRSTNYNIVSWARVPKAKSYKVYRASGNILLPDGNFLMSPALIGRITDADPTNPEPMSFNDTGTALPGGPGETVPLPVGNTTGGTPMLNDGMPVSFSSSGDAGNEILIVSGGTAYCYGLETDVFAPVMEGATFGGFIDSYFVVLDAGSSTLKVSESLDGFRWDPTQVYQRSRAGDKFLSMAVTSNEIWMIGSQTGEVWRGTGDFEQRFVPFTSVFIEAGIIAAASLMRIGGTLMWLAQDKDGAGVVIRTNGYTPTRVSPVPVEWSIQALKTIADAFAFTYQQEGHLFYVLTFPSDDITWVYDFSTNEWHKRGIWDPDKMTYHAYRPQCHAFAFGGVGFGKNLVGDRLTGVIAHMHPSFGVDINGTVIRRMRQTPHVAIRDQEVTFDRFQIDMDVGLGFIIPPISTADYQSRVIADGAIAYWRLGELTGTTAYNEIGGNNGTIHGTVLLGQASSIGGTDHSMYFNGLDGYIAGGPVRVPVAFSTELWIRTTMPGMEVWSPTVADISGRAGLLSTRPVGSLGASGLYIGYWYGGTLIYCQNGAMWSGEGINDDKWHHVVYTHDGTNVKVYVDGRLITYTIFPGHVADTFDFRIGRDEPNNEYFKGYLDEVALYAGVLTKEQVAVHYQVGIAGVEPSLLSATTVRSGHPTMMLSYSNNGGRKFGPELWRSVGKVGETDIQVAWSRLGTGKDRVFRLVATDPAPWRLVGAWLELEGS